MSAAQDDAPDIPPDGMQNIVPALHALAVPLVSVRMDERNARKHNQRNLDAIADSLARFRQRRPIVVRRSDRTVLAGNGTLAAAQRLGWPFIAAALVEDDDATARAYAIADNRSSELATWDWEALHENLTELQTADFDVHMLGFTDGDLHAIARAAFDDAAAPEEPADDSLLTHEVTLTADQFEVVARAVNAIRVRENSTDMSEGRALELMAMDFLAGHE